MRFEVTCRPCPEANNGHLWNSESARRMWYDSLRRTVVFVVGGSSPVNLPLPPDADLSLFEAWARGDCPSYVLADRLEEMGLGVPPEILALLREPEEATL